MIVLDNYQDLSPEALLHQLLPVGLSEIPPGIAVVILSRTELPAPLARVRASSRMALLEWHDLRLTEQESLMLAALLGPKGMSRDALRSLHEQAGGWAAGLVLLLQGASHGPLPRQPWI